MVLMSLHRSKCLQAGAGEWPDRERLLGVYASIQMIFKLISNFQSHFLCDSEPMHCNDSSIAGIVRPECGPSAQTT